MKNSHPNRLRFFSAAFCCAALVCSGLAACGAVRMETDEWQSRLDASGSTGTIDPRDLEGDLVGHSVLTYVIERDLKGGGLESWTLTIAGPGDMGGAEKVRGRVTITKKTSAGETTLTARVSSRKYLGTLSVAKGHGESEREGGRGEEAVPLLVDYLARGFAATCTEVQGSDDSAADSAVPEETVSLSLASSGAMMAGQALIEMASASSCGFDLVKQLIQYPSWWRWLIPTLDMSIQIDPFKAQAIETELGPGWVIPVQFLLKGDPAFYAKLTVVEPGGALVLGGGIIAGVGFAPDRPDQAVRWHLESAGVGVGSPPEPE